MHPREICDRSATELTDALRGGLLTSEELVAACLDRIEALDASLRAFVTVDSERALVAARESDRRRAAGDPVGLLHGLPVAVKDVTDTAELRTTHGSRLYADHVPDRDAESVARLKRAGAIVIGKTNTPEFAFGAVCTNSLCGPTANPWDQSKSSGGSSGGSAVAVATGMVPLAQGTDFGGSVRTPASFCGIVGLRPTPGTIPEPERRLGEARLASQGILARSVSDALLMLQALSGPHPLDPVSRNLPFPPAPAYVDGIRVARSVDLNGEFAVDPWVRDRFEAASHTVEEIVGPVAQAAPDMAGGKTAFAVLRAAESWFKFGRMVEEHEAELSPAFVWNVRQGREISAESYLAAEAKRTEILRNALRFFEDHDVLVLPAASVPPFRNDAGEVTRIGEYECKSMIDYLACTFLVSLVGFPCLSLPAPVPAGSLPFGLQLVAPPGREALLWGLAMHLEANGFAYRAAPILEAA